MFVQNKILMVVILDFIYRISSNTAWVLNYTQVNLSIQINEKNKFTSGKLGKVSLNIAF